MVLLFYDTNKKGEIDHDGFTHMIVSAHATSKRVMRSNTHIHYSNVVTSYEDNTRDDQAANALLMKCIEKELQFGRDVMILIESIKGQYDYDVYHLFSAISDPLTHNVTKESLKGFFSQFNCFYDKEDLEAILHRLDLNQDSFVSFDDFSTLFSFIYCRPYNSNSPSNISFHSNHLYEKKSFVKQVSPSLILRQAPFNYCHCGLDEYKEYTESIEERFMEYFKLLIDKERAIEKAKVELMIRPDFNITETFRLFDRSNKGYLFISDIQLFFENINERFGSYELKLINKRCDFRHKGYITYAEFFDFLAPFEADYRKILEERVSLSQGKLQSLSEGTLISLVRLVHTIIEAEKLINGLRLKIRDNKKYLIDLFRSICKKDVELFTIDELIAFFKQKGMHLNDIELSLLFIRLDRNRTGKIELFELDDEFTYVF